MIEIKHASVMNFENAIRGMRNPLSSWEKSDSFYYSPMNYVLGKNDLDLAKRLCKAGSDDRKFLRQILVSVDIKAPLYFFKEFDQYKVATVTNSTSTMHKIHAKEFTLDDFSCEHLLSNPHNEEDNISISDYECYQHYAPKEILKYWVIPSLNACRKAFIETKDKEYWWQMIQLLPTSYNQLRTCTLNYEVLRNIYHARKNHKLDCWKDFCKWIETLPYAKELIIGE